VGPVIRRSAATPARASRPACRGRTRSPSRSARPIDHCVPRT
jgi:hypothetical protein